MGTLLYTETEVEHFAFYTVTKCSHVIIISGVGEGSYD